MKKLIFLLALIPSLAFSQTMINLSPDSTIHDLHALTEHGTSYISEYQIVHDKFIALGVQPDDTLAAKFNALVDSLVQNDSVWYEYDVFANFAVHDSVAALVDWRYTNRTFTANSGVTFIAYEGFTGNGTSGYIDMNYDPTNDGSKYLLQDCHYSIYLRVNQQADTYEIGYESASGNRCLFRARSTSNAAWGYINSGTRLTGSSISDVRGYWLVNRETTNDFTMYLDNTSKDTDNAAGSQIGSQDIAVLAWNDEGVMKGWSTNQASMFSTGGSFSTAQRGAVNQEFEFYMDSNGKGVQ